MTITVGTLIEILISIICSVISGTVLFQVQRNKRLGDERRAADIAAAVLDRELQLANAEVTELMARKIDGEGINGELHAAALRLTDKRGAVERHTTEQYFRRGGNG